MAEDHLISLIIPIYNVEQYLSECLDSAINQTYRNVEIILVNDGSTDTCPQICDAYAAKDQRIIVIHQKNKGLSAARNAGVDVASGEYISFVDSDDVIREEFCQTLLKAAIDNSADIVECGFCKFVNQHEIKEITADSSSRGDIFKTEEALKLLMNENLKQTVWNKIYRRSAIGDYRFPVGRINEDEYWTYKVFGNSKTVVRIADNLYFYRQQEGSIMAKKYSLKRLDGLHALEERIFYIKDHFPALENLAIKRYCWGVMSHYRQLSRHREIDSRKIVRIQIMKKARMYNKWSMFKSWHWKEIVWFQLFLLHPKTYMKVLSYFDVNE